MQNLSDVFRRLLHEEGVFSRIKLQRELGLGEQLPEICVLDLFEAGKPLSVGTEKREDDLPSVVAFKISSSLIK
jgi:hypothetical protein